MYEPRSFAYALNQLENGWRWSVYDENGVTVADGSDVSQAGAQARVNALLNGGELPVSSAAA